jgi:hypothetical protein
MTLPHAIAYRLAFEIGCIVLGCIIGLMIGLWL